MILRVGKQGASHVSMWLLVFGALAWPGAQPHLYLRRMIFEHAPKVPPGTTIDLARAQKIALTKKQQLILDGYRDAKVDAELIPAGFRKVDLRLRAEPGKRYRVRAVRFSGDLGMEPARLRRAMRAIRPRRPFSDQAVETDLARLRSLYISQGYFDAEVRLSGVERVEVVVHAGTRRNFQARELCGCFLEARRKSETEGRMDFAAEIEAGEGALNTSIRTGEPYTVGRIDIRGVHHFSDAMVRRALVLEEGALLDADRLRRSLVRVNRLGWFELLRDGDVEILRDPTTRRADVVLSLTERPRGSWQIWGPRRASVESRLPIWPTYTTSLSLPKLFSLTRPVFPGQWWQSGLTLSPQLGWKPALISYGIHHLSSVLSTDRVPEAPLPISVKPGGLLFCEEPKSRWSWLRVVAQTALGSAPVY